MKALILALLVMSLITSPSPIFPNPASPNAQIAYQQVVAHVGANAVAVTTRIVDNISTPLVAIHCGIACVRFELGPVYDNVTGTKSMGWQLTSSELWSNLTNNCYGNTTPQHGPYCENTTLQCDNLYTPSFHVPTTYFTASPCFTFGVLWNGSPAGDNFHPPIYCGGGNCLNGPNFTVTRIQTWSAFFPQVWVPFGQQATLTTSVTGPNSSAWGVNVKNITLLGLTWNVPYPKGNWDLSQAKVTPIPGQTQLGQFQYKALNAFYILQWGPIYPRGRPHVRPDVPVRVDDVQRSGIGSTDQRD